MSQSGINPKIQKITIFLSSIKAITYEKYFLFCCSLDFIYIREENRAAKCNISLIFSLLANEKSCSSIHATTLSTVDTRRTNEKEKKNRKREIRISIVKVSNVWCRHTHITYIHGCRIIILQYSTAYKQ